MSSDRQFVTALARGLELLGCFTPEQPLLGNADLARRTGMARSSVSRLTHTLLKLGYLEYDGTTGAYRVGLRVLPLQPAALAGTHLAEMAAHVEELGSRLGATVLLTVYEQYGFTVIHGASTATAVNAGDLVGRRYPIPRRAMGRAYMACCSGHEQEKILAHLAEGDQDMQAVLEGELDHAVRSYRSQGYCTSLGDVRPGNHSIGVILHLPHLGRRAALACGGPADRMTRQFLRDQVGPRLMESAANIERASVGLVGSA
ncbi:MAG TPA: IclR family transcriptional regulator [Ramlibacter sp.]|nr:IclR family transcriptional regulator [Ramlibacter sp.]